MIGPTLNDKLRLAASKGQTAKVLELLEAGARFDVDREGRNALHLAAHHGYSDTAAALILAGCDVNTPDFAGHTALQRAAAEGHVDIVKQLVKHGAHIDHQDEVHGNTALHEASWKGYSQTLDILCKGKANIYIKNKGGFTPLHLACQNGHNQTCRVLLLAGCKPDVKNNYGDTPIHTAARYGHAGVLRILVSARCKPSEQNKNGDTALHISSAMGRRKLTRILLEADINFTLKNKQDETALDIAVRKEFNDVKDILQSPPVKRVLEDDVRKKREKDSGTSKDSKDSGSRPRDKKSKPGQKVHFPDGETPAADGQHKSPYGCHYSPNMKDFPSVKLDSLPKDPLRTGEQYYLDLGGNIKKGPIGVGCACYCVPFFQHVERKLETDKQELLEHIDLAHDDLQAKLSHLERRTRTHLQSLQNTMQQSLAAEREDCAQRLERNALRERAHADDRNARLQHWLQSRVDMSQHALRPDESHYPMGAPDESHHPLRLASSIEMVEYHANVKENGGDRRRIPLYQTCSNEELSLRVADGPNSNNCMNADRPNSSNYMFSDRPNSINCMVSDRSNSNNCMVDSLSKTNGSNSGIRRAPLYQTCSNEELSLRVANRPNVNNCMAESYQQTTPVESQIDQRRVPLYQTCSNEELSLRVADGPNSTPHSSECINNFIYSPSSEYQPMTRKQYHVLTRTTELSGPEIDENEKYKSVSMDNLSVKETSKVSQSQENHPPSLQDDNTCENLIADSLNSDFKNQTKHSEGAKPKQHGVHFAESLCSNNVYRDDYSGQNHVVPLRRENRYYSVSQNNISDRKTHPNSLTQVLPEKQGYHDMNSNSHAASGFQTESHFTIGLPKPWHEVADDKQTTSFNHLENKQTTSYSQLENKPTTSFSHLENKQTSYNMLENKQPIQSEQKTTIHKEKERCFTNQNQRASDTALSRLDSLMGSYNVRESENYSRSIHGYSPIYSAVEKQDLDVSVDSSDYCEFYPLVEHKETGLPTIQETSGMEESEDSNLHHAAVGIVISSDEVEEERNNAALRCGSSLV